MLKEEVVYGRIKKILLGANIDSISAEEGIQCIEEFDYCFKLSLEEAKVYKSNGYVFPSLRPEGSFSLCKIYF